MPVISKAGCSKTITAQTWTLSLIDGDLEFKLDNLNISFEDCNEDLADHYGGRFSKEQSTLLSSFVTGECDDDKPSAPAGYRRVSS